MKKSILFRTVALLGTIFSLTSCDLNSIVIERQLSVTDPKAFEYKVGDVFDDYINNGGMQVKVIMSDNSSLIVDKADFTYEIHDESGASFSGRQPFTKACGYVVSITKDKLPKINHNIQVKAGDIPTPTATLSKIEASDYTDSIYAGEQYNFDGTVIATYSDGSTKEVTSKCQIDIPNTDKKGSYVVSISYTEDSITQQTSFNLLVEDKPVTPGTLISIVASDYKINFIVGDEFTFGGTVMAYYSDNTSSDVTSTCSFTGYDKSKAGTQTVTVCFNGKTTTYQITVSEKEEEVTLESISASGYETTFTVGDTFEFGGIVTAHYSDGSSENVTEDAKFSGFDMSIADTQIVTVSYSGKTTTYEISVDEKEIFLESITVVAGDTTFTVGDEFKFNGTVTAHYTDGSSRDVTNAARFTGFDMLVAGTQEVLVSYGTETTTYNITVVAKIATLSSITVVAGDATFTVGDEFKFNGTVTAHYSDSSTKDVTNSASFGGYDMQKVGTQTVVVSYDGQTTSYSITVNAKVVTLTSIQVNAQKVSFTVGDPFAFEGTVIAHYSDSSTKDVTNSATFDGYDMSKLGTQVVFAKYEGMMDSYEIYVAEVPITVISVTGVSLSESTKMLNINDSFTLVPTVQPSNATNKNVSWSSSDNSVATVTNGVVTALKAGNSTITVTTQDQGKTASCVVSVKNGSPAYETITVEEAVSIIDSLEMNVVSNKEYYIRGVCTNVELDNYGFNGGFINSNLKFRSVLKNNVASTVDDIDGKEIVIYGYLENYNNNYQIPYLPASASPTGSKYNAKLIEVESSGGGDEEAVNVTNVSISPVSKTLFVGESATLLATVLPQNATNKTLTWNSSNSSVCTVSNSGEITAKSVGTAVITATSANGVSATSNITVENQGISPIEGDSYEISFVHYEVDGQTELNSSTIGEQISTGSNFIGSFNSMSKLFKGVQGIKFGSNKGGGSLSFSMVSSFAELDCKEVIIETSVSGTSSKTVSLSLNDTQVASGSSSDGKITAEFSEPIKVSEVYISTSGRAYISKITFICGEITPIPVTAISIPSTKSISLGNSELLSVSYTPTNANTGKTISWKSSDTSVATVSNGLVNGIKVGTATITATSEEGFASSCVVTVSEVAVTSVSLSPTLQNLYVGGTKQLTATISPSNASNKTLTWSSSNTGVATVSSSGLVTANAVGSSTITVKSNNNKQSTCVVEVTEKTKDAWTILIYMCGADLESESGLATGDIKEILSVNNQPDDVNIVIETGGAKSWSLGSSYLNGATKIDSSKLQRWHIENKKLTFDESLSTYTSMGSSSTLQSFVEYGIKEYPAEKTGVIFWNHGGAMYGCCYDEKKNDDSLTNSEMKSAFSKALANTGSSKLEFVGYDTCLTQVQDIAEFNSNYFNYMIASEEAEAGEGWDYDTWVDDLYAKKDTGTILTAIVDGFIKDNGGVSSTRSDQTLSWLDLSQMAAYKTAFESFASALKSKLSNSSVSKSTFAKWMDQNVKAFCVDSDQDEAYYCLFDVKDMLNKLSSNSTYNPGSSYISALNTAFSNLVKYSVAQKGAGNAYGLGCIYCQASVYSSYIKSAYTSTETNFSNWLSFCKTYSYLG